MCFTVIVAPWFILIFIRHPEFVTAMINEARGHAIGGKEGHSFPPGYHLALVWPMFMPWSLLLPLAIGTGLRHRKIPEIRFALAAVLGPWLMVEFMGTKLPHYFLPAYPALAFLVAFAIGRCRRGEIERLLNPGRSVSARRCGRSPWRRWAARAVAGGGLFSIAADWDDRRRIHAHFPYAGVMISMTIASDHRQVQASALVALLLLYARRFTSAFVMMGLGMLVMISLTWTLLFSRRLIFCASRFTPARS